MAVLLDLTPLRSAPAYRRLWLGLSVSNLGTQFTVTAVGLQVYSITGSTFSVGVLGRLRARAAGAARPLRRRARGRVRPAQGRADRVDRAVGGVRAAGPAGVVPPRLRRRPLRARGAAVGGVRGEQPGPVGDHPAARPARPAARRQRPADRLLERRLRRRARCWGPSSSRAATSGSRTRSTSSSSPRALGAAHGCPTCRPSRRRRASRASAGSPRSSRGCATWRPARTSG